MYLSFVVIIGAFLVHVGEFGVEIRVDMGHLRDVAVEFLNERDVLGHIVGDPGLVVVVHLLNEKAIAVQNGLNLLEAVVESGPHLRVALFGLLDLVAGGSSEGGGGGGVVVVVLLVAAASGGVFHLSGRVWNWQIEVRGWLVGWVRRG
ncbi:hypothetical protein QN277_017047 [Acacia crassicarpa]|uniref:Secreted protein n=1 Tax=Acacia crassicarpa TaxID=499986 RepID=A0AAE1JN45_9FABA|nr:hypothetical protein QN277_017047 [Acacia crassicarpa]